MQFSLFDMSPKGARRTVVVAITRLKVDRGRRGCTGGQEELLLAGREVRECGFDGGLLPFELLVDHPRPGYRSRVKFVTHQSESGNAQLNQLGSRMNLIGVIISRATMGNLPRPIKSSDE